MTLREIRQLERERRREWLVGLVAQADGNLHRVAAIAGIRRQEVYKLMHRYGVQRPEKSAKRVLELASARRSEAGHRPAHRRTLAARKATPSPRPQS